MPSKNRLEDLRNHLFETIERLKDKDNPMEVDRAKAVAKVAGAILESAKVELRFLEVTKESTVSEFMVRPDRPALAAAPPNGNGHARLKCNQCDEQVLPAQLGEHKRAAHPLPESPATSANVTPAGPQTEKKK